jgi:MYXO-CTERM domain-containing protein
LRTGALLNGRTYAIGVSGQDLLGNAGELSEIRCGTPVELDDFFELYSRRGGVGGGGFCSLSSSPGGPHPRSLAGLGLLVAALLWRRARSLA